MSGYYLGVDGGQSSTTALIGDGAGNVIGVGRGGACGHLEFLPGVRAAIAEACLAAGLDEPSFNAACLGFSGGVAGKRALLQAALRTAKLTVTHDAAIALEGALAGEPGVIVIAGTGSIAYGRNADGSDARAGGWGYVFGDEGGAFDIVRQALRAALRFEEGWGPRTVLRAVLLEASGAADANELLHWAYRADWPRDRLAKWAPLVEQAANAGDALAAEILRGASQALALLAAAVRRQLFTEDIARVSYAGGVFQSERVLETFRMLAGLDGSMEVMPPLHSPAAGALIGAYRLDSLSFELRGAPPIK